MAFWLMKSEPSEFSIDDLARVHSEPWDGVRNYQACNMLKNEMQVGDLAFFYHSKQPTIRDCRDYAHFCCFSLYTVLVCQSYSL